MNTFQPIVAFNNLGVNIFSAKALVEEYGRELLEVEALITRVEDDKREDERVLRFSKEAMRLQLRRQIDDLRTQELVEVEQLEATSHARRAPLDEKRKSLLFKIDEVKTSIAPIRNIPTEILGYIFREVVALNVPPWLLTTINNTWRRTALTNPWLWSNIIVGKVDEYDIYYNQFRWLVDGISRCCYGNGVICRSPEELAYFAKKSGAVPLDVRVCPLVSGDEWEVLHHLFGPHLSSRIRSLSMSFGINHQAATGWIIGPLPLLQKLSCCSTWGPILELIMAQAHQIKSLKANHLSSSLPKYPFWKTLRTLNLELWADANELNKVIAELRLIELIEGLPKHWPNIDTPIVTLEHIKFINLTCRLQHLARLRLPQLGKLVWSQTQFSPSDFGENLDFSTDLDWGLSFPNLLEFEACAAGEAFAVALTELPNVHTALLNPVHSKNSKDPWALDLIRSLAAAEDSLCPNLCCLTLKQLKANKTIAKPLIRQLITSRKALGVPFTCFEIVWAKRSGKDEEIVQYA